MNTTKKQASNNEAAKVTDNLTQSKAPKNSLLSIEIDFKESKEINKRLKEELKTLGHCLDNLIKFSANPKVNAVLRAIKKDSTQYEMLKAAYIAKFTTEKHGAPKSFSAFRVLQVLRKK